jgi:hypothetical protein
MNIQQLLYEKNTKLSFFIMNLMKNVMKINEYKNDTSIISKLAKLIYYSCVCITIDKDTTSKICMELIDELFEIINDIKIS